MLIWAFFLVLVCETCAQSLSAAFSYTLYTWELTYPTQFDPEDGGGM
jgi:hypothetical protein